MPPSRRACSQPTLRTGPQPQAADFSLALGHSLLWNIGLLCVAFCLALMLPRRAKHEIEATPDHAAAV